MRAILVVVIVSTSMSSSLFGQAQGRNPYMAPSLLMPKSAEPVPLGVTHEYKQSNREVNGGLPLFEQPLLDAARPPKSEARVNGSSVEKIGDMQKEEAIQALLLELAGMSPGEYGSREKLLEILQLERLAALKRGVFKDGKTGGAIESSERREEAYALRTSIWTSREIPVSWDVNKDVYDRFAAEREWVREAIRITWERECGVRFTGWGLSNDASKGIRIAINDEGPHCKKLGRGLDGMPAGMVLNFTFQNWCSSCAINLQNSVQYIAVHEFGHALGLAHEQNRDDAPTWCQNERQGSNGDWFVTIYDPQSIMNYCNKAWNNDGKLSELDKRAVRIMYGDPSSIPIPPEVRHDDVPFSRPLKRPDIDEPNKVPVPPKRNVSEGNELCRIDGIHFDDK